MRERCKIQKYWMGRRGFGGVCFRLAFLGAKSKWEKMCASFMNYEL